MTLAQVINFDANCNHSGPSYHNYVASEIVPRPLFRTGGECGGGMRNGELEETDGLMFFQQ